MNPPRAPFFATLLVACFALLGAAAFLFQGSGSDTFMPHAHCYLFNERLMLLHGGSDLFIGISYVAISGTLTYLVLHARQELPFHWMMLAFALFIVACGTTHFMELWTLQSPEPRYWLSGWVKLITALASLGTAILLPPLVPKIRAVLQSARLAGQRKTEIERAYAELETLYERATAPRPRKESLRLARLDTLRHKPQSVAHMARQVTEHARELEQARQAAEAANFAKDQFLAVLSHELRTPLTPALAAASHLENSHDASPDEFREALSLIRRNIELEARLVDDLLDLTRITKGKLQIRTATIDLHETIHHAAEMCRSQALRKRLDLRLELEAGEHHLRGDAARLAQIFWNLLLNAVKFTPEGGAVTVRTSNPGSGELRAEVRDTGLGIEPGMLGRVFEPFQQGAEPTARRLGGLGLGLTIARGLVEAHDGTLTASSPGPDRGAVFTVEFPTTTPLAAPPVSSSSITPEPPAPSLRVLLVEDHDDTRHILERLLTRWGHVVKTAPNVATALEIAADFAPELLLTDLGLPDGTGIELLGKLRQKGKIRAIVMSGFGMESDLEQTRRAGFSEHLIKPIPADRLKEAITHLIASQQI